MPGAPPTSVPVPTWHVAGHWQGSCVPNAAIPDCPANPICWSLALMPQTGRVFGAGFFSDAAEAEGGLLHFHLFGSISPDGKLTFKKQYFGHPTEVEYSGTLTEAEGQPAIRGEWHNTMEGTFGTFVCRLEEQRPPPSF